MASQSISLKIVTISRRGADRIRAGHVWVYRSDVVDDGGAPSGAVVLVKELGGRADAGPSHESVAQSRLPATKTGTERNVPAAQFSGRGRPPHTRILGSAFYSSSSEIAIRMISSRPVEDVGRLVRDRIRAAIAYRERFVRDSNAYRVIFSEGDFLPGLIVDRYNDVLSFQVLTQALDSDAMRGISLSELKAAFRPRAIVERVDARVRRLEQLPERETGVVWESPNVAVIPNRSSGEEPASPGQTAEPALSLSKGSSALKDFGMTSDGERLASAVNLSPQIQTEFHMNGVRFVFDPLAGQKTGAFLDQRENYAAAAQYARGDALDVFCYQGGFALHLARVCDKVTGVDSSRPALEAAEENAKLNGREIEWMEANAFDLLRDYADAGQKYDCIVLDPPAFAKSRQNRATALRGYKELNLRALKMLRPGGVLVTCSCSYHVSAADLLEVLASAALDSHRNLRILENRRQAKDHPSVLGIPETAYLKCLIVLAS